MLISEWSSDVCSSDLALDLRVPIGALHQPDRNAPPAGARQRPEPVQHERRALLVRLHGEAEAFPAGKGRVAIDLLEQIEGEVEAVGFLGVDRRSEENTSELQSLMRTSYAVFCLK